MSETIVEQPSPQGMVLAGLGVPSAPYRGIYNFRLVDRPIFRARDADVRQISRLVTIYRAVVISGSSGAGKTSLLNAGLIPALIEEGSIVERVRVQPLNNNEFFVERISLTDDEKPPFLTSVFAPDDSEAKISLSAANLEERIREMLSGGNDLAKNPTDSSLVLICDQFEESVTLFEEAPDSRKKFNEARVCQEQVFNTLNALVTDEDLPVKLVFSIREDYQARVLRHIEKFYQQIKNQVYPLAQLSESDLESIIEGPYEAKDHHGNALFQRRLAASTCRTLKEGLRAKSDNGLISLTEAQIACRTLWDHPPEEAHFNEIAEEIGAMGAVHYLYDQFMEIAMKPLSGDEQRRAKLALTKLITSGGTRNIVSKHNLFRALADDGVSREDAEIAMNLLCKRTRLVYLQARGNTPFYEIVSESLIPWIIRQDAIFQEEKRGIKEEAERNERIAKLKAEELIKEKALLEAASRLATYRQRSRRVIAVTVVLGLSVVGLASYIAMRDAKRTLVVHAQLVELAKQANEEAEFRARAVEENKLLQTQIAEVTTASSQSQGELKTLLAELNKLRGELAKSRPKGQESDELLSAITNVQQTASSSASQLKDATDGLAKVSTIIDNIDNLNWVQGKTKVWGGPGLSEGWGDSLALIRNWTEADRARVFRRDADRSKPPRPSEFDPETFYITAQWVYSATPREWLLRTKASVRNPRNPGKVLKAQPVDWGPPPSSGATMAISPGLAVALGLKEGDEAAYSIPAPPPKK